jgi:fumarylacetoacetase
MDVGDLLGSGTISGPEPGSSGCLLEITYNGKEAIKFPNGEQRTFVEDGDTITFKGYCESHDVPFKIGFGECSGKIQPALSDDAYF